MRIEDFNRGFKEIFEMCLTLNHDSRDFQLLPYTDSGIFGEFVPRSQDFTYSSYSDYNNIEIYFKTSEIERCYTSIIKDDLGCIDVYSYLATHEYGHTLFCDSNYTLKIIFEQEFKFAHNFNFLILPTLLSELAADRRAFNMIPKPPSPMFNIFFDNIKTPLSQFFLFRHPHVGPSPRIYIYGTYVRQIKELIRFYVYNKWNDLIPVYTRFSMGELLDFFRLIIETLDVTLKKYSTYDSILSCLIRLANILDSIKINEITLGRVLSSSERGLFQSFHAL